MRKLRIALLVPATLLELVLLAAAWACALVGLDKRAVAIQQWADRILPSSKWYLS